MRGRDSQTLETFAVAPHARRKRTQRSRPHAGLPHVAGRSARAAWARGPCRASRGAGALMLSLRFGAPCRRCRIAGLIGRLPDSPIGMMAAYFPDDQ